MSNDILKLPAGRFLGQTLRAHELADFHITEVFYPNGMHQPEHMHEAALYCFVISGTYIERFGHREEVRLPLAVNFYPTGTSHAESYRAPGRHLAHVARVFRAFKNCTLGEYVRALRIKHAAQRMARTDASLAEIAAATGFSDQSHFSRTFKRQTGLLPSEFRASLRLR